MAKKRRKRFTPTKQGVKKRQNQSSGMFDRYTKDGIETWVPKEDDHTVRILPPTWDDADHHGFDVFIHSGVGPDNQSYLSLKHMKEEPDPIEEAIEELQRKGADEDMIKKMKAYKRVAVYVIVRGEESKGPQLWYMPFTMDKDIMVLAEEGDDGFLDITDEENGYDFSFRKEGKGLNTKYEGKRLARNSSPISDDVEEADEWLDFVEENPIPDQLQYFDYDHISRVFGGVKAADEEEDEEEPRTRASRRRARRSDPPEEKDSDEDESEDEEEEEPPARGRRRSRKSRSEEIEDEDEELDDEDEEEVEEVEDEPPRKRRRRRARA